MRTSRGRGSGRGRGCESRSGGGRLFPPSFLLFARSWLRGRKAVSVFGWDSVGRGGGKEKKRGITENRTRSVQRSGIDQSVIIAFLRHAVRYGILNDP